jgi:hypothetical protein
VHAEPAVEPHAVLVACDGLQPRPAHAAPIRMTTRPAKSAATLTMTEPST